MTGCIANVRVTVQSVLNTDQVLCLCSRPLIRDTGTPLVASGICFLLFHVDHDLIPHFEVTMLLQVVGRFVAITGAYFGIQSTTHISRSVYVDARPIDIDLIHDNYSVQFSGKSLEGCKLAFTIFEPLQQIA